MRAKNAEEPAQSCVINQRHPDKFVFTIINSVFTPFYRQDGSVYAHALTAVTVYNKSTDRVQQIQM